MMVRFSFSQFYVLYTLCTLALISPHVCSISLNQPMNPISDSILLYIGSYHYCFQPMVARFNSASEGKIKTGRNVLYYNRTNTKLLCHKCFFQNIEKTSTILPRISSVSNFNAHLLSRKGGGNDFDDEIDYENQRESPDEDMVENDAKMQQKQKLVGPSDDEDNGIIKDALINFIRGYKAYISPILPPACRFLPTCSEYGIEAIQTYGIYKGSILTCWRILRCNPFGGSGYDPVQWPPPKFK